MSLTLSPLDLCSSPYTVIVLVQNELDDKDAFIRIWNNAAFRIAVDGGTNHWHALKTCGKLQDPTIVCGDFDSIRSDVRKHVEGMPGVKVIPTPDQDETDFTKALYILRTQNDAPKTVITFVSNQAGRCDQQFSNLNTLIKSLSWNMRIFLYDHVNILFPIPADKKTEIRLHPKLTCGIIPINGPTRIRSSGLKWNLDDVYQFGRVVSTSNETVDDVVTLEADKPLIFTVESLIDSESCSDKEK